MATQEELISILESRGFERDAADSSRHEPAERYSLAHPDVPLAFKLNASVTYALLLETRATTTEVADLWWGSAAHISVEVHEFSLLSLVFLENILDTVISEFVEAGKEMKKEGDF